MADAIAPSAQESQEDLQSVSEALRTRVFCLNLVSVCFTCYCVNLLIIYLKLTDGAKHSCCNDIGIFNSLS